jgi:hypothetical protein
MTKFRNRSEAERKNVLRGMIQAGTNHKGQSNHEFAKSNGTFIQACEAAGVEPTVRQASKFRNKRGAAYNAK